MSQRELIATGKVAFQPKRADFLLRFLLEQTYYLPAGIILSHQTVYLIAST